MNENIEQHYRHDELSFLESIDDLVGRVENEYRPMLTNFLNPRQQYIVTTIANRYDSVQLEMNGGNSDSEMKRVLIYPDYYEPVPSDFLLTAFLINYPQKFATLTHGQILGTLMGSGIDRDVIGDIITDDSNWEFIVNQEMADYIKTQIDHIGRTKVRLKELNLDQLLEPREEFETTNTTVASLRLDAVISESFHISRHHAKELVDGGMVKVNWTENTHPDYELAIHDVISVRGFGRSIITAINGVTKKDKIRLELKLIKPNK